MIYRTGKIDDAGFEQARKALGLRLDTLGTTTPIAFRKQNAGDYCIPELTLRADLAPGASGLGIHVRQEPT